MAKGYVYFVRAAGLFMIKIGYSADHPSRRLAALQVGSPVKLDGFGWLRGNRELERDLHERFSKYREHGEWFRLEPEIVDFCVRKLIAWQGE